MLNFDTDLDTARSQGVRKVVVQSRAPQVRESLTVTRRTEPVVESREYRVTDIGKAPEDWSWEDLRNYVVRQIETRFGPFPIDPPRLASIFRSFHQRHGAMAGPIAVTAFDLFGGKWKGSNISVNRFCKASDKYFAEEIAQRLTAP
jgi:hypothetical protein